MKILSLMHLMHLIQSITPMHFKACKLSSYHSFLLKVFKNQFWTNAGKLRIVEIWFALCQEMLLQLCTFQKYAKGITLDDNQEYDEYVKGKDAEKGRCTKAGLSFTFPPQGREKRVAKKYLKL